MKFVLSTSDNIVNQMIFLMSPDCAETIPRVGKKYELKLKVLRVKKKRKKKTALQKSRDNVRSKYWRKKADTRWSLKVRARDGNRCVMCGATENAQAHHLIDRSAKLLRHKLKNGLTLCPKCHKFNRRRSAHKGAIPFVAWLARNRFGQFSWVLDHWSVDGPNYDYKLAYELLEAA